MTKAQINTFNKLLADPSFKGKKQLRHLLWLNTTKPKFDIGECFKVSDPGHRLFGYPVKDFNAKITEIKTWKDEEEYFYSLEFEAECNGKSVKSVCGKYESYLTRCKKAKDNKNTLGEAKSEYADESSLAF